MSKIAECNSKESLFSYFSEHAGISQAEFEEKYAEFYKESIDWELTGDDILLHIKTRLNSYCRRKLNPSLPEEPPEEECMEEENSGVREQAKAAEPVLLVTENDFAQKIKKSCYSMFKLINPRDIYRPAMITTCYYLIGGMLVKHPITSLGTSDIDVRFSFGVCIPTGLGKDAIKNVVWDTAKHLGMHYSNMISLHEEQLIGKTIPPKEGETKYKQVKGYFDEDFLLKDDALTFLNSPHYEIARNYFLQGLNTYGRNLVKKQAVAIGREGALEYCPQCSFLCFIQPSEKIKQENINSGLFRRMPILRIDPTDADKTEILNKRFLTTYHPAPELFYEFLDWLRSYQELFYDKLPEDVVSYMNVALLGAGFQGNKELCSDQTYSGLTIFFQNTLIKWAYIHTLMREFEKYQNSKNNSLNPYNPEKNQEIRLNINIKDMQNAVQELFQVNKAIISWIAQNNTPAQQHPIEKEIMTILTIADQYSLETSKLSKKRLIEQVKTNLNLSEKQESTIQMYLHKLKKQGIIHIQQVGQHSSRVWLYPSKEEQQIEVADPL